MSSLEGRVLEVPFSRSEWELWQGVYTRGSPGDGEPPAVFDHASLGAAVPQITLRQYKMELASTHTRIAVRPAAAE